MKILFIMKALLLKIFQPNSGLSSRRLVLILTLMHFFAVQWVALLFKLPIADELLLYTTIVLLSALGIVGADALGSLIHRNKKP